MSRGVAIGAQVSYPDRENFGRVALEIDTDVLSASIAEQ
ncbi:MAG: LamB/YcsF family protein, partial [Actinomycetota bacterium]